MEIFICIVAFLLFCFLITLASPYLSLRLYSRKSYKHYKFVIENINKFIESKEITSKTLFGESYPRESIFTYIYEDYIVFGWDTEQASIIYKKDIISYIGKKDSNKIFKLFSK